MASSSANVDYVIGHSPNARRGIEKPLHSRFTAVLWYPPLLL